MASPIRFSGMASGLDTEKMVKELMNAERAPVNKLQRNKKYTEWKRDAYREMNTLLLDLQKAVDSIRFSGNFNKKTSTSENDSIVSSKVTGKPSLSTYAIEVKKLARAEMPAAIQVQVDSSITSTTQAFGGTGFTIKVNGVDISASGTDTIDSFIGKVNSSTAGVEASYADGKILFKSKPGASLTKDVDTVTPGTQEGFEIVAVSGTNPFGITTTPMNSSARTLGSSAEVVINGITYTSNTNTITYDGIEYTLKQTNIGTPINVSVKTDEDAVFNSIKAFVDKYNEVIAKINAKISEPKNKGYEPLLDEEIEKLPEKTAEKLDEMAKSGILLRDTILKSGLDSFRNALNLPLKNASSTSFDTLSEIGITGAPFGKYAYQENGKLYIDETKLRQAISQNGSKVTELFTKYGSNYDEKGLAERLYDELSKTIKQVTEKAGSSTSAIDDSVLGRDLKRIDDEIDRWEDRLQQIEDRYWKQFNAMEKAMAQMQSQSSWFAQMLGGQ
jgi:flagellar hook-associated protein 2